MGLMMLAATLTLQAGNVTLAWDYSFEQEPSVQSFRLYALQGSNSVFTANNNNAYRSVVVTKEQATNPLTYTLTNGVTTNLIGTISNLHSGWWTFTATAINTNQMESVNSETVSAAIRPSPVWSLYVK